MLTTLYDEGTAVSVLEKEVIAPALVRLGEMWVRGRLGDNSFRRLGGIAEQVEREFRQYIVTKEATNVSPADQSEPR
jgi:hypothetical protein